VLLVVYFSVTVYSGLVVMVVSYCYHHTCHPAQRPRLLDSLPVLRRLSSGDAGVRVPASAGVMAGMSAVPGGR